MKRAALTVRVSQGRKTGSDADGRPTINFDVMLSGVVCATSPSLISVGRKN